MRKQPERHGPDDTLKNILLSLKRKQPQSSNPHGFKTSILNKQPSYVKTPSDIQILKNVYDWHYMFLSSAKENSPDLKIFIGEWQFIIYNDWVVSLNLRRGVWRSSSYSDLVLQTQVLWCYSHLVEINLAVTFYTYKLNKLKEVRTWIFSSSFV